MPSRPRMGQEFQQESAPGIAIDEATIVGAGEVISVPLGTFADTIRVSERNPLDGDESEKVYARGVGLLLDATSKRAR